MFERLGHFSYRWRWIIVAIWFIGAASVLFVLPRLEQPLKVGGFSADHAEAAQAARVLEQHLGFSPSSMVIVYTSDTLKATDAEFQNEVAASLAGVRSLPFVENVILPSTNPRQIAKSGEVAYAIVGLRLPPERAQRDVPAFEQAMRSQPHVKAIVAGGPAFYADIETASQRDLRRAEVIAFPFALIALLFVYGSVVAASIPLIVGGAGVALILVATYWLAHAVDLSIFVLNLATMLGLGLAVDYSLFITSRFREELHHDPDDVRGAVGRATSTAGKAVFVSGMTVLIGLAGLTTFPLMFLRSVGIAGVIVVVFSVLAALTLLPAVLGIVGTRIDRLRVGSLSRAMEGSRGDHGFWHGLATFVMRRPIIVALPTLAILVVLGLPFLQANISSPDARILPQDLPSRQGFDLLSAQFAPGEISPFVVTIESDGSMYDPANVAQIDRLTRKLAADSRIDRVESATTFSPLTAGLSPDAVIRARQALARLGIDTQLDRFIGPHTALILAYPKAPANDPTNKALLHELRSMPAASGTRILVGGGTGEIVDVVSAIYRDFPRAALLIVVATYLILLVMFRSIVLPIKAILMNTLSIFASYGALVWIFQEGHLAHLLDFTPLGFVEASLPVIMFCVLFGLSMDYEVFLLSRIREEWDASGDNARSVALGLQRSGQIITSAALIVVVVTASFVTADVVIIKALGLGIAIAVALDASVVRALLVPATMELLGRVNWWIPRSLDRLLPSVGLREATGGQAPAADD